MNAQEFAELFSETILGYEADGYVEGVQLNHIYAALATGAEHEFLVKNGSEVLLIDDKPAKEIPDVVAIRPVVELTSAASGCAATQHIAFSEAEVLFTGAKARQPRLEALVL